jgi:SNF2 family DNA or RNA helicase
MKVIMCDIDGVLNDAYTRTTYMCEGCKYDGVDKSKIDILREIVKKTGAKIVISSTWRKYRESMEYLIREMGPELASNIIGQTPDLGWETSKQRWLTRADEIDKWLSEHPDVKSFVVLDDLRDEDLERFGKNFIRTSMAFGLTEEHIAKCVELLQ